MSDALPPGAWQHTCMAPGDEAACPGCQAQAAEIARPSCPCPALDCERDVACRPPAPTCPHPFYGPMTAETNPPGSTP